MSTLVHNERVKLLANALDRTSTACVAVASLAPIVAVMSGVRTDAGMFGVVLCASWILPQSRYIL